jgi:hypothetical protein
VNAAFSFGGTELVGLAAAETANPLKTLPKATKQVTKKKKKKRNRRRRKSRKRNPGAFYGFPEASMRVL